MTWLTTLRARLLATYLGLIVLGFGGLTLLAGWQIANSAYTDFASTLQMNTVLLAANLASPMHEDGEHGIASSRVVELVRRTADGLQGRVLLLDRTGKVVLDSSDLAMRPQRQSGFVSDQALKSNSGYLFTADEAGVDQIVVTAPLQSEEGHGGYLQLAAPVATPRTMVQQRWLALGVGFVLFAMMGILMSLWLLSTLVKPLTALRTTALQMAAGDLTQRVPQPGTDEVGAVGRAFNQMATQVEAMVAEQRAFAGNASHELRTPLTTLRLRTEALLNDSLDPSTSRQYIAEIDREVTHMSGLVDDLILLSYAVCNKS
jgi:signal transduction histidine kinase